MIAYPVRFRSCENTVLWRGHFLATGNEKSVNLSINGGEGKLKFIHIYEWRDVDDVFSFKSFCCQCLDQ